MFYVCVRDVIDVVVSSCVVRRGAVGARVWEVLVLRHADCIMLDVCVLCASCGSSQCCVLNDLYLVNAGRGCKRRLFGRGILQSRSHDCLVGSHECLLLCTQFCCGECFYYLYRRVCVY